MSIAAAIASFDAGVQAEPLVAFAGDAETRAAIIQGVAGAWSSAEVRDGGLQAAIAMLSQEPSPPLVVVDIAAAEDPVASTRALLALCEPATRVVLLGAYNDVALYRALIQLGAADYLVKPVAPEALAAALHNAVKPPAAQGREARRTKVISVVGTRGGVGASTVAVNLAWILAHEQAKMVALVDLDLQFGTVALALDLEPSNGLREAFENPDRVDGLFIQSAMMHESERLYVMSAEEPLEDEVQLNPAAFDLLLEALPGEFDYVVVDLPSRLAVAQRRLIAASHGVVLVSELSLAAMRDTARFAQLVRDCAPEAAITVVVNKVGAGRKGELPRAEFQKGSELPVKHFVPFDPKVAGDAANSGKPFAVVNGRAECVTALRKLGEALAGPRPRKTGISALARLLKPKAKS